jgi:hypothetical protein
VLSCLFLSCRVVIPSRVMSCCVLCLLHSLLFYFIFSSLFIFYCLLTCPTWSVLLSSCFVFVMQPCFLFILVLALAVSSLVFCRRLFSGPCLFVFLCLVFVCLLSFLPCFHVRRKIRRSAAMDVADVASLDATVLAWDRWMGCILCPYPAGSEEKVNLLEKGEVVLFYKRKKGEEARYSRQATEGICLPTDINACPERWREVSAQIALWAWDGRSIIGSQSDQSNQKGTLLDKIMMCSKCRRYEPGSSEQAWPCPIPPCIDTICILCSATPPTA